MHAANSLNDDCVHVLLALGDCDADVRSDDGWTALSLAINCPLLAGVCVLGVRGNSHIDSECVCVFVFVCVRVFLSCSLKHTHTNPSSTRSLPLLPQILTKVSRAEVARLVLANMWLAVVSMPLKLPSRRRS